ncbi:flavodoxin [Bifidobacterium sp. 82T24]|uniref:flavodoxin n=1 Tax=Bifidobacterium pluvialisilvae TaxID=2834436 RepID=UPI001C59B937|nr:flavodoxin [Bifidobacterium pluvialisilvae]MBW3088208.1 flavodoxin [Bifidobacterium pluvialisilvae]
MATQHAFAGGTVNPSNAVIAYFSRTGENYAVGEIEIGNTANVAAEITRRTGAPTIEITPVEPYPHVYDEAVAQATAERKGHARPPFTLQGDTAAHAALEHASTVFLGYPIWWSDMPMPVYTFLESRDWTGVTIAPFCTHEGSGLADTASSIARITGTTVLDGLELRGATAQYDVVAVSSSVKDWLMAIRR